MDDYISREAALACFSDWIDRYGHEHTADEMTEYQKIEELPAADVREVVRGEWVSFIDGSGHEDVECSVCGETPSWICTEMCIAPMYCPNCGADMRGEQCSPLQKTEGETR